MGERSHERLYRLFCLVSETPRAERAAVLERECGGDAALRARVETMIAAADQSAEFLGEAGGAPPALETVRRAQSTVVAPRESVGEEIGRYRLLQQVGEGGFGTVWMAEQREPVKRRVALKIIKLGMDTKQVIARFEAERQALALMDHPSIAKVFDAGSTDSGRPYFVMEYIKGMPIVEYCDTEKLDTAARLTLFSSVCAAVQHAHQKGIIHRDIKPSNVLITMSEGAPVPKVIDFGIAKATNTELTTKTLFTEHRQMVGTPAYMSPEQAEMSGLDIDTRSDIYSLGVLLYELLTGTTPFDNASLMEAGFAEMMRIIREEEPHKPSTRLSSMGETASRTAGQRRADVHKLSLALRGDLDWIVMKCLEKDRTRRYETANGLAADIGRHLADEPVTASPPSTRYRVTKFVRRNRGRVVAAALVVAALVIAVIGTSGGLAWALREKGRADSEATNARVAAAAEEQAKLDAQENEQKARDEAERAERELVRATEIKRLITEMLASIDPETALTADTLLLKGILNDAARRLNAGEVADELVAAELHHLIGVMYRKLGLYSKSEAHLPKALEINRRRLGPDALGTISGVHELGNLYHVWGRFDEAEALYREVIETQSHVGSDDVRRLAISSRQQIGSMHTRRAEYDEAEATLREVVDLARDAYGVDSLEFASAANALASLLRTVHRYDDAQRLYNEILGALMRSLGDEHPMTLAVMGNLSYTYHRLQRYTEAEAMASKSLENTRAVYGDEHPHTMEAMSNLALILQSQERLDEAESMHLNVLAMRKRVFGEEHRITLATMSNLGVLYNLMKRHEDAVRMFEFTVPRKRRTLGPRHPWTLSAVRGLMNAYMSLNRANDAGPLLALTMGIRTQDGLLAAADAPNADAKALHAAADSLLSNYVEDLRDPARALSYAERACAVAESSGDPDREKYLETLARAQQATAGDAGVEP